MATKFEEKLISSVFIRRYIYDKADPNHSKKEVIDSSWTDIAKETGKSKLECKRRWRSLKDTFMKCKKLGPSGSGSDAKKKWVWFDNMLFLSDFNEPESTTDNFEPNAEEDDDVALGTETTTTDEVDGESTLDTSLLTIPSTVLANGGVSKKRKKESLAEQWGRAFEKISASPPTSPAADNITDAFAKYIASEMKQLDETEKDEFKWEVANLLRNIKRNRI